MSLIAAGSPNSHRIGMARWSASLALVLLAHLAAGIYLASRHVIGDLPQPEPSAVMIDLAPAPEPPAPAPPPEPVAMPPPPPPALETPPEPPLPAPEEKPKPPPKSAVVVPTPRPPPRVQPRPIERQPAAEPERPAVASPPTPAAIAPPPAAPAVNPAARTNWEGQLMGRLERYKRYPSVAREERQEGVVYLRFTIDRAGRVLSAQIAKSSGIAALDEEVSELIQRAQPLPAPPSEVPGAQITITLPVQFALRNGGR